MMFQNVKCPSCGGKNCLPVAPYFDKKKGQRPGLSIQVKQCLKCGIKLSPKDYMRLLKKI